MAKFEAKGFDDLEKQLNKMMHGADNIEGEYSFDELFPTSFMQKNTQYGSIDTFLENCGFPATSNEEFEAIPEKPFDEYVAKVTNFSSWEEMQQTAAEELVARKLGLD